jgi:two-component system response regulator AtoC
VRVLTSTNRDLEAEVGAGRFREDLFYRINVVQVAVPALRDRAGDVLALAQHFINEIAIRIHKPVRGISTGAARLFAGYDWPGNVRELENCVERAVALCRLDELTTDDLPLRMQEHARSAVLPIADSPDGFVPMKEMQNRYIGHALRTVGGNKTRAARALGIDRRSLYRWLEDQGRLADAAAGSAATTGQVQGDAP